RKGLGHPAEHGATKRERESQPGRAFDEAATADGRIERALLLGHGLALPRGALDRAHDAWIGATTTDVAVHVGDDLLARGPFGLCQKLRRLHDLPRLAVAALRHLLGDPGL